MTSNADPVPETPSTFRRILLSLKLGLVILVILAIGGGGIYLAWKLWDWVIGLFE